MADEIAIDSRLARLEHTLAAVEAAEQRLGGIQALVVELAQVKEELATTKTYLDALRRESEQLLIFKEQMERSGELDRFASAARVCREVGELEGRLAPLLWFVSQQQVSSQVVGARGRVSRTL